MKEAHVKEIENKIHQILIEEWDPIGVKSHSEAQDEYDSYIGGIQRLLLCGRDRRKIVDHLRALEVDSMGLRDSDEARLSRVAEALLRIVPDDSRD